MKNNFSVTVFGDSIAKGLELDGIRPKSLKTNAVEMVKQYFDIDITNNSCFGQTITRLNEKKIIDDYITKLDDEQNNVAIFCIGGNDSDFDWKKVAENPTQNHDCKTPIELFEKVYCELIYKLKERNVKVYICALPIVSAKKFFDNYICRLADGNKVLQFFDNDISNITRHQEKYNTKLHQIADKTGSKFLDIRAPFLSVKNINDYYCADGIRPNEKGHKLIAEYLNRYFENNA